MSKSKVMIIAVYYQEPDEQKIKQLLNLEASVPKIHQLTGTEVTCPYNGEDKEDLFLHLHNEEKAFMEKTKKEFEKLGM